MPDKPLRYTRHARSRMRWNAISSDLIETCVSSPDQVTPSVLARRNCWLRLGDSFLRVTIAEEEDALAVVTVAVRRRGPGGETG
jgi:hypothetical protein